MNRFLESSKKVVSFDERGYLRLDFGTNKKSSISPRFMSSGELQILIILSHLIFNPDAREDNVFMIDEPELSLHISWQEIFVDSLVDAAPELQFIFATHSPTIIIGRRDSCVAIGPER